jgi:ATP-dependent Clp protease adaptor protein ClpS
MARRKKKESTDVLVPEIDIQSILDELNFENSKLIVLNDNHNTFDWVISTFMEVLHQNYYQAEQCALIIHNKGKCAVKEGQKEILIPLKETLTQRGLKTIIQ